MVRVLIGIIALLVGLALRGTIGTGWAYVADIVGAIALLTGLAGYCPLYAVLGVRTCGRPA